MEATSNILITIEGKHGRVKNISSLAFFMNFADEINTFYSESINYMIKCKN